MCPFQQSLAGDQPLLLIILQCMAGLCCRSWLWNSGLVYVLWHSWMYITAIWRQTIHKMHLFETVRRKPPSMANIPGPAVWCQRNIILPEDILPRKSSISWYRRGNNLDWNTMIGNGAAENWSLGLLWLSLGLNGHAWYLTSRELGPQTTMYTSLSIVFYSAKSL